jgi:hypothetical protein
MQDIVFERFLLQIVQKEFLYKEAKTSEGDSPSPPQAESENTIYCHNGNLNHLVALKNLL